uniref:Uncharacterized protein n=1 Tax=Rhodnius prolixus TaxID=13249 RepID=T1HE51_RHOPR
MKAIVRDPAIEEMKSGVVIMDRRPHPKKGVPLSGPMVREKAKYLYAHFKEPDGSCSARNVSPIIPYKLPFRIHGFCIRGIFMEHIPRE